MMIIGKYRFTSGNLRKAFGLVYEDDPPAGDTGGGAGGGTPADNPPPTGTGDNSGGGNSNNNTDVDDEGKKLKFTPEQQQFINRQIAAEKRKLQQQNEKTINDLRKLQNDKNTTDKQRQDLQKRIEELQQQFLSKEELAKSDFEKKQKEFQQQIAQERTEKEHWKQLFHTSQIDRAIQDEAMAADAFNPAQIRDILLQKARLDEDKDGESKPTGTFTPRVKLEAEGDDGKVITLDLTVREAIKKMKDTPEKYGNLFKSGVAGGIGGNGSQGGGRKQKPAAKMSTAEYIEARKKDPNLAFVQK